tara:strand:+ start:398 stop:532 length:135 start_codon:yes stop_codon:yes gene_type:complete
MIDNRPDCETCKKKRADIKSAENSKLHCAKCYMKHLAKSERKVK